MPNEQDYYRHRKSALEQIKNEKWVPGLQAARFRLGYGLVHHTLHFLKFAALSGSGPKARGEIKSISTHFVAD
jgi:hypothetical protein